MGDLSPPIVKDSQGKSQIKHTGHKPSGEALAEALMKMNGRSTKCRLSAQMKFPLDRISPAMPLGRSMPFTCYNKRSTGHT